MDGKRVDRSKASSSQGSGVPPGNAPRGGLAPFGRLSSIRPARDLTLGGVVKKEFKPTIPARRKTPAADASKKQAEAAAPVDKKPVGRGRGDGRGRGGRGRGRGRGRGERKMIESESIFSAGPAEATMRRTGGWGGGGGGGGGGQSYGGLGPPVFTRTGPKSSSGGGSSAPYIKSEPMDGNAQLPVGLGTDEYEGLFDSEDDADDLMDVDGDVIAPVQLPLATEVRSSDVDMLDILTRSADDDREELVFIQLPDTLPAHTSAKEDGASAPEKVTLADLPEGYLGQLVVRKSGRVELVLGDVSLDVDVTGKSPCFQEAVSVRAKPKMQTDGADDGSDPNGLYFLGQVQHHIVCTPDFESLLKKA